MKSHASNPIADHLHDDVFRIYFTCRNEFSQGHVGFVEIDLKNPTVVLNLSSAPVLKPGITGAFDDSGVTCGCVWNEGTEKYLYYLGWNLGVTVPFRNAIGLAKWNTGSQQFERVYQAPVLDRNRFDLFSLSYPFVLRHNGEYKMWYGTHLQTGKQEKDMKHAIRYVSSASLDRWNATGHIAIPLNEAVGEYALSRPSVLIENNLYKMWYAYRGNAYRIGYAESSDGLLWNRKDDLTGIQASSAGWDSEMICYPHVFTHNSETYMVYNGNGYGKSGFGIAKLS